MYVLFVYKLRTSRKRIFYSNRRNNGNGSIDSNTEILQERNYTPFGVEHVGYNNNVVSTENNHKTFQGQKINKELGLNWHSFKYRNYDPAIGRFMSIDPLAEKYKYNSTYAFAENKVIDHIELEGLEGFHHTKIDAEGNRSHTIEKKVIILTEKKVSVPAIKTTGTKKEIRQSKRAHNKEVRKNSRIESRNNSRIAEARNDLKSFYGGEFKNRSGESVTFQFNISTKETSDTTGKSGIDGMSINQFSNVNGLVSSEQIGGINKVAPAAILTTQSSSGNHGSAVGNIVQSFNFGSPPGTVSHEIIHTLGVGDNGYTSGGILNSPPQLPTRNEIDAIINASYKK